MSGFYRGFGGADRIGGLSREKCFSATDQDTAMRHFKNDISSSATTWHRSLSCALLIIAATLGCQKDSEPGKQNPSRSVESLAPRIEKQPVDRGSKQDLADKEGVVSADSASNEWLPVLPLNPTGCELESEAEDFLLKFLSERELKEVRDRGRLDLSGKRNSSGGRVTDADIQQLNKLTCLRHLNLLRTHVTDAGLIHLEPLTNLEYLNLGVREVTDAGLIHLKGMRNLRELVLNSARNLTGAGFAELRDLDELFFMDLGYCPITDSGLSHLAELKGLRWLHLTESHISDDGMANLKRIANLEQLSIDGSRQITDRGVVHLAGITQLTKLSLSSTAVTDAGVLKLNALRNLKRLSLSSTQVGDASIQQLSTLPQLQFLQLSETQITDAALDFLKSSDSLRRLYVANTGITDDGLSKLEHMSNLKYLDTSGTEVTEAGVTKLKAALPECEIH